MPPLELGGVYARIGMSFQDHVAAGFLMGMVADDRLLEVWCENQDDVTLIWRHDTSQVVEFVQVKSAELDHLWSVSELCRRTNGRAGTSVLERSLAYDRADEVATFRLVTTRDVAKELAILKNPCHSASRDSNALLPLRRRIETALPNVKSPNGHDILYWLENALWEVRHSESAVRADNLLGVSSVVHLSGEYLAPDQIEDLYERVRKIAYDAALAKWSVDADSKRVRRFDFATRVRKLVMDANHPSLRRNKLRDKLVAANVPLDVIDGAQRHRQAYRAERLQPRYVTTTAADLVDLEVDTVLSGLRAQLDAGAHVDGILFHNRCVEDLEMLRLELKKGRVPKFYVQGCMYDITDRCLHRFTKDRHE